MTREEGSPPVDGTRRLNRMVRCLLRDLGQRVPPERTVPQATRYALDEGSELRVIEQGQITSGRPAGRPQVAEQVRSRDLDRINQPARTIDSSPTGLTWLNTELQRLKARRSRFLARNAMRSTSSYGSVTTRLLSILHPRRLRQRSAQDCCRRVDVRAVEGGIDRAGRRHPGKAEGARKAGEW